MLFLQRMTWDEYLKCHFIGYPQQRLFSRLKTVIRNNKFHNHLKTLGFGKDPRKLISTVLIT